MTTFFVVSNDTTESDEFYTNWWWQKPGWKSRLYLLVKVPPTLNLLFYQNDNIIKCVYINCHLEQCIQNLEIPLIFGLRAIWHLNILILWKIPYKVGKSKEKTFFYSQDYLQKWKIFLGNQMYWNAYIVPVCILCHHI